MYEIKNCRICGKIYQSVASKDICPNCEEKDNLYFARIRDFLHSHPRANIFEVVSALDIPISMIKYYLKEYRLEIVEKEHTFLICEICGHIINSGRYCEECCKKTVHNYKSFCIQKPQVKTEKRLNYLQSNSSKKVAL